MPDARRALIFFGTVGQEGRYVAGAVQYADDFDAEMGADAIKKLLGAIDLNIEADRIRRDIEKTNSKQKIKDLTKRLKLVEALRSSENKSEWMVMDLSLIHI